MDLQQRLSKQFGKAFADLGSFPSQSPFSRDRKSEASLEKYMSVPAMNSEERREKRIVLDEKKKKKPTMIIMKNSDQNVLSANHPTLYVKPMAEINGDVYGDRSGIYVWGYEVDHDMWYVKRKSLNVEYYQSISDFSFWTAIDLAELVEAPFHNPTLDNKAWNFKKFLENQKKSGFKGMKIAKSFLKKSLFEIDLVTKQPIYHVMWPKTKQVRQIPLKKALPDGSLDTLQFWAFDEATTTVVIKTEYNSIRLVDTKDLLMFRERDIKRLAKTEIINDKSLFVLAAKEFMKMAAAIVDQGTWADQLEKSDVNVLYKEA